MANCPHCGAENVVERKTFASSSMIRCKNCGKVYESSEVAFERGEPKTPEVPEPPRFREEPEPALRPVEYAYTLDPKLPGAIMFNCIVTFVFFFFTWVDFGIVTQSGFQALTGDASLIDFSSVFGGG